MKRKLLLIIILVAGFATFIGIKYFKLDKQSSDGVLKILTSPNSSIFLNSNAIGKTPYENKVKEGEYLIKLVPEGTATEAATWGGKVSIYKNTLTYIDRELGTSELTSAGVVLTITKMKSKPKSADSGEIAVETEPDGSIIYLDNDEKGIASLIMDEVPKGEHELSVSSPGFFRRSQKVNVEPGYRIMAQFKLAIDPAYRKVDDAQKPEATGSATITPSPTLKSGTLTPAPTGKTNDTFIIINDTPTGWLRVRDEPSLNASEAAKVKPGDKYKILETKNGWYRINYKDNLEGWIAAQYTTKAE